MQKSPCKSICKLDPNTGLCLGCRRTIDEINNWNIKKDKEKEKIIEKAKTRKILEIINDIESVMY